ncbi:hypothetical protein KPATCC21470_5805 [Kitasatospora purpeofusca]
MQLRGQGAVQHSPAVTTGSRDGHGSPDDPGQARNATLDMPSSRS